MAVDQRSPVTPESAPARLVEISADVRAAVMADPAGGLVGVSNDLEAAQARELAGLAADLFTASDRALGDPAQQVEAQVLGGSVYAVRSAARMLACVARRTALPALVLYDLQAVLTEAEAQA